MGQAACPAEKKKSTGRWEPNWTPHLRSVIRTPTTNTYPPPRHIAALPTIQGATSIHARHSRSEANDIAPVVSLTPTPVPTMSPGLKPLILPQLVEEKRRMELHQATEGDHTVIYYTHSSSSSDLASPSPVTPTSSRTHLRYSGSSSSLASAPSESPASPAQPPHGANKSKSQLPDVQEDPSEREEEDNTVIADYSDPGPGLYDCLCMLSASLCQSPADS